MCTGRSFLAVAALSALLGAGASAEPVKIRMSYIVPVTNWAPMLFQTPGLAKHLDTSYSFEAYRYQGTPLLIQALASGELQIANMSYTALPLAIGNAGMQDIRIIADEIQDGVPGFFTTQYLVKNDGPIKTVDDLKGRTIGTNVVGSGTDVPLREMLRQHNLKDKVDLTIIEVSPANSFAMFLDRKIEMFSAAQPNYSDPRYRGVTRTLFTQADAVGRTELGMWVARASFIAQHRAALVDFLEDALRQERWYYDPANRKEAASIAAKVTKQPAEQFENWIFTKNGAFGDYCRDLNGRPDIDSVQASSGVLQRLGFLNTVVAIKDHVDLSLVEEAAGRLK